MKYSLFVLVWSLIALALNAESKKEDDSGLLDVWKNVNFLSAKMNVRGTKGFQDDENFHKSVEWKEDTQGRFYRRVRAERYGELEGDTTVAYDGEHYCRLNQEKSPSVMTMSRSVPDVITTFTGGFFPLEPFQYLGVSGGGESNSYPSISALHLGLNNGILASALASAKPHNFNGKEYLMITLPVTETVIKGKTMIYNVYLTTAYPHKLVGWERVLMPDKQLESSLIVDEWKSTAIAGSKQLLEYPSKYTRRFYDYDKKSDSPEIVCEYEATVSIEDSLENSEESSFTVDPSVADRVYDYDNNVMIKIPR